MNNPQIDQTSLLPVGTLLQGGKYRIDRYLSSGNFGNTYIVTNTAFGEQLAMKEFFLRGYCYRTNMRQVTMSPAVEPERIMQQRDKFKKEALRMRELKGEHVVHVYDLFDENSTTYYVMDYVQGESLATYMEHTGKPLTEEQTLYILNQLLDGLEEVHQNHIWHLDLKPDNIMIDRQGKVVIIDFGASKQLGASGKYTGTTGVLCYTPGFAPFEQMSQDMSSIGPWTDIYALGATLYNLLTNITPSMQSPESLQYPTPVSKQTRDLIAWMMTMERQKRPQSIAAIRGFLARNTQQQTQRQQTVVNYQAAQNEPEMYDDEENQSKRKWMIAGIAGAAALLLVILLFVLGGNSKDEQYDELRPDEENFSAQREADSIAAMRYNDSLEEALRAEKEALAQAKKELKEAEGKERKKAEAERAKAEKEQARKEAEKRADEYEQQMAQQEIVREQPISVEHDNKVYDVVEQMPSFPGGDAALMSFLNKNIKYPVIAEENGIQGRVVATFVVERDGSITDVKVIKSVDPSLDKEAVRVLKLMPKWIPGKQSGKAVRVKYTVPVTFRLQ